MDNFKNFARVTVSTGYSSAATTVVLAAGQGALLPSASFNATWWNATDYSDPSADPFVEIVRVTNVSTDTLTITRAQESTTAQNHNSSGKTYQMIAGITAKTLTDLASKVPGAVTGTIDGSNTVFTLPWTPSDVNSVVLYLNQQPYLSGLHFTVSGATVTYLTAPDASFAGLGHYATGQ